MNQNPMQLFQMFAQLRNKPNALQLAKTMFGNNPLFNQAIQMTQGKDRETIKSIIKNVAKERNIGPQQLSEWAPQFGLKM